MSYLGEFVFQKLSNPKLPQKSNFAPKFMKSQCESKISSKFKHELSISKCVVSNLFLFCVMMKTFQFPWQYVKRFSTKIMLYVRVKLGTFFVVESIVFCCLQSTFGLLASIFETPFRCLVRQYVGMYNFSYIVRSTHFLCCLMLLSI